MKNGRAVYRCSVEQNHQTRVLELPQRMFEPAVCCQLRMVVTSAVSCTALLDLKARLRSVWCSPPVTLC